MRPRITIWLLCVAAILAWTGVAGAQTAAPTPKVQLPSGETVWDLSGDWDAFIENYGPYARFGIYLNVFRITQTGNAFTGIRLRDNPYPSPGRAGSLSLRGELDKNGFTGVWNIDSRGDSWPAKGQISADGKKVVIDNGTNGRITLTRSGDRAPLVGLWRLISFVREYQGTGDREYPMGFAPTGYILFQPEGRMWVVITGDGRKAPTTDQDRAGLFNSLVAYSGPYRVDGDTWITTVEVSMNPAWVGAEQARTFQINGDRLQETSPWMPRPDNRMARAVITYERVKPGEFYKLKTMLLRPAGWKAYWSAPGDKGETDFTVEVRGDRVVAKLQNLTYPTTCEREVTISADVVKFDGCFDREIALRFDPNDRDYPFKGTSFKGYDYKVKAK